MLNASGRIKLFSSRVFKDDKTGADVPRFTYHLQLTTGEVLKVNSKRDFSQMVDQNAIFSLNAYAHDKGGGFWLTLVDVKPDLPTIKA